MVVILSSMVSVPRALVAYANHAHARSVLRALRITFHSRLVADFTGSKALSPVIEGAIDHIDALVAFAAKASNVFQNIGRSLVSPSHSCRSLRTVERPCADHVYTIYATEWL